jgi:hypothetical protein
MCLANRCLANGQMRHNIDEKSRTEACGYWKVSKEKLLSAEP